MFYKSDIRNYFINIFLIAMLSGLNLNVYSKPFDELIKKILIEDENINSSKFLVKKAENDVTSVNSIYTPKLDLTLPLGNEKLINNNNANTDFDFYEFNAKVTQNIYDFGGSLSKIDKARNQLKLSEISLTNVKSNKIYEAISAYLNYIKAHKILNHAKESEERIKEVTNLENEKVARGAGLASNVLQSKARLAGAKSTSVKFQGDLSISANRFYNIFRELPGNIKTFNRPRLPLELLPNSEEVAINIAKKNNISLSLSKLNLKNTKSNIKSSKSKFFPTIKAVAEYKNKRNSSGLEGTEIDQIYKLEMNYPISIGGPYGFFFKESADYKSSINQYMVAKYGHEKMQRNIEESVRNAWQTKEIAKQNFEYLENQANISGEFFDLAMKEVKLGNRQLIDILSSETAYINAKSAAESANTEYQLAVYQLLLSIGILDEKIFSHNLKNKESRNKLKNKNKIKVQDAIDSKSVIKIKKDYTKLDKQSEEKKENKKLKFKKPKSLINNDKIRKNQPHTKNEKDNTLERMSKIASKEKPINLIQENIDVFKVQLGAFSSISNANKLLKEILDKNILEIILNLETDNKKKLFKIRSVETFDKKGATKICKQFTSNLFNCIIQKM